MAMLWGKPEREVFLPVEPELTEIFLAFVQPPQSDSFSRNNRFECRTWMMRLSTDEPPLFSSCYYCEVVGNEPIFPISHTTLTHV